MKRIFLVAAHNRGAATALVLGACVACQPAPTTFTDGGPTVPAVPGQTYRWSFDQSAAGARPDDLINVLGTWSVVTEASAPSAPNALRQSARFGDPDFPRAVVKSLTFGDLTVRVRCRPESGSTDQACGLMFHLTDSDNYYLTRANALEGNVNLYHVIRGDRQQISGASAVVTAGQWHTLEATAKGPLLTVKWDGAPLINATDTTFASGKIGLWTKADSVTAFDDLEATAP